MHPLQSEAWAKARKQMGIETISLEGFLLTLHKIPFSDFKIGYLPRSRMPGKRVLQKLYEFGKKNKVIFIKIEPYEERSKLQFKDQKLFESKHPLFPAWTQTLDLNKSDDELLKSFHSKTRYNIRLAEKKGVIVREESNDNGFEKFAKLYFETSKRQRYFGHDYQYHKTVWDNLKNTISHILIAYYKDIPLAAYQLWYLDDVIYYVYGGTSELHRNLMASNLLMWEAIRLGKKLGAEKFDMWGSLAPNYDANNSWSGFTRFKEGYGTKFTEFVGSYDLVINKNAYNFYNLIYKLREKYLKIKSLLLR